MLLQAGQALVVNMSRRWSSTPKPGQSYCLLARTLICERAIAFSLGNRLLSVYEHASPCGYWDPGRSLNPYETPFSISL